MRLNELKEKYPQAIIPIQNIEMVIEHINEFAEVSESSIFVIIDMIDKIDSFGYVNNISLFVEDLMTVMEEEIVHDELRITSLDINKIPKGTIH